MPTTRQCAVVHAVPPNDLGLPDWDDGRAYLLYAYEGESMASILEGNSLFFLALSFLPSYFTFEEMKFFLWSNIG
jgi:hypothetical protein